MSGYESGRPRLSVGKRAGSVTVRATGGPITDRQIARLLAREVVLERRGRGTAVGRALLDAWRERQEEKKQEERADWEDHGSWAYVG